MRMIPMLAVMLMLVGSSAALQAAESGLTPPPGDPLRAQVLEGLRREMARTHGLELIFVVEELNVKDGWAWVATEPQSPDGTNRYEPVSALLQQRGGAWRVVEMPCTEVDNPECLGEAGYFKRLRARYPSIPVEVLPRR
jgi:hypothetical protein